MLVNIYSNENENQNASKGCKKRDNDSTLSPDKEHLFRAGLTI